MECVCSKCGSDNIQRLEVIYEHGTQDINTSSKTVGVGLGGGGLGVGGGKTKTSGQSQSVMAQKAAPPAKKKMVFFIVMVIVGLIMASSFKENYMVGLAGLVFLALGGFLSYKTFIYNKNEFPLLYQTWLNAWMCNKCGNIFVIE